MKKGNFYTYETNRGTASGMFNIYQDKAGAICLAMANGYIRLTAPQVDSLAVCLYDLIDFDIDSFNKCYHSPRLKNDFCTL